MLNTLKRFGGAVPRLVDKYRRGERLFVQIRGREAWEQDYRDHKWDQLVARRSDAGNLAVIGHLLAVAANGATLRLLDVGCGNGGLLTVLQGLTAPVDYLGTDLSSESLSQLKSRYPDAATICADMMQTEHLPGSFDLIVFNECLYYADYDAVLDRYRGILRHDGRLIISMVHNAGRPFIWRRISDTMHEDLSFTIRNDRDRTSWTVKLLRYR
jgi:SAM-dependent methyltransferase